MKGKSSWLSSLYNSERLNTRLSLTQYSVNSGMTSYTCQATRGMKGVCAEGWSLVSIRVSPETTNG